MEVIKFQNGDPKNIAYLEDEFSIELPVDYRNFLIENNGADIENGFFYVKEINQAIPMGYFFGIDTKEKAADIVRINKEYGDDIAESSFLIGNDIGSGFLLLVFDGENDGIWYYDHTYFFKESTDELNTYFIAESFADFLKILETTPAPKV
ncbi:SMI1/KNR4 family protein [Pedobacter sp. R20-19]|uniref:SMI1/KNR4 family protein n=1 Tax=Pedobacter sp. R20-19 TaxID=1270196 RepID=UPI00068DB930|nr:SMI1/KNR4 family protein [Pedobacter sp. R20-19]